MPSMTPSHFKQAGLFIGKEVIICGGHYDFAYHSECFILDPDIKGFALLNSMPGNRGGAAAAKTALGWWITGKASIN